MTPVSPVIAPEFSDMEITYAKNQSPYRPLPVHRNADGVLLSRWKLTVEERQAIANGADLWLYNHTFNQPLQPVRIEVSEVDRSVLDLAEYMGLTESVKT